MINTGNLAVYGVTSLGYVVSVRKTILANMFRKNIVIMFVRIYLRGIRVKTCCGHAAQYDGAALNLCARFPAKQATKLNAYTPKSLSPTQILSRFAHSVLK